VQQRLGSVVADIHLPQWEFQQVRGAASQGCADPLARIPQQADLHLIGMMAD
jgi:hypothetical protein